jgi:hypothetical protein
MKRFFRRTPVQWLLLTLLVFAILLACRTLDLITGNPVPPASQLVWNAQPRATQPATRTPTAIRPTGRAAPNPQATEFVPTIEPPTEPLLPTEPPRAEIPVPTSKPAPTRKPPPTSPATAAGPAVTAVPTRCPQKYCVVYHGCQTDSGNTIVEGFVYNNGVPENGVVVRVAKEQGAYPLVDDFVSGNSSINPGQLDPNYPGHYILQIVAGAPREGNWWVFVVDVPNGTKQLSEAKYIHTNDDPYNPVNCQHAMVDFIR